MITLAIPTYNRLEMVFESFSNVISSEHITEICIVDDCSDLGIFTRLENQINDLKITNADFQKINIYRNDSNLGSFLNKLECVKKSKNEWIILLDSDNIINMDYVNIVSNLNKKNRIYAPSHAICNSEQLNYTCYSGKIIDKIEYKNILTNNNDNTKWDCIFNTGNYFFNRESYLKAIEIEGGLINSLASDAYYLVYLWFNNLENPEFEIVENLKYLHRLHDNSHYIKTNNSGSVLNGIVNYVKSWN
jgi:hypothetical protein